MVVVAWVLVGGAAVVKNDAVGVVAVTVVMMLGVDGGGGGGDDDDDDGERYCVTLRLLLKTKGRGKIGYPRFVLDLLCGGRRRDRGISMGSQVPRRGQNEAWSWDELVFI